MKRFRLKWTKSWGSITCGHATAATNFENNIGGLQEGFGSLPAQGLLRNHANTKQAGRVVVDSKIRFVSGCLGRTCTQQRSKSQRCLFGYFASGLLVAPKTCVPFMCLDVFYYPDFASKLKQCNSIVVMCVLQCKGCTQCAVRCGAAVITRSESREKSSVRPPGPSWTQILLSRFKIPGF